MYRLLFFYCFFSWFVLVFYFLHINNDLGVKVCTKMAGEIKIFYLEVQAGTTYGG